MSTSEYENLFVNTLCQYILFHSRHSLDLNVEHGLQHSKKFFPLPPLHTFICFAKKELVPVSQTKDSSLPPELHYTMHLSLIQTLSILFPIYDFKSISTLYDTKMAEICKSIHGFVRKIKIVNPFARDILDRLKKLTNNCFIDIAVLLHEQTKDKKQSVQERGNREIKRVSFVWRPPLDSKKDTKTTTASPSFSYAASVFDLYMLYEFLREWMCFQYEEAFKKSRSLYLNERSISTWIDWCTSKHNCTWRNVGAKSPLLSIPSRPPEKILQTSPLHSLFLNSLGDSSPVAIVRQTYESNFTRMLQMFHVNDASPWIHAVYILQENSWILLIGDALLYMEKLEKVLTNKLNTKEQWLQNLPVFNQQLDSLSSIPEELFSLANEARRLQSILWRQEIFEEWKEFCEEWICIWKNFHYLDKQLYGILNNNPLILRIRILIERTLRFLERGPTYELKEEDREECLESKAVRDEEIKERHRNIHQETGDQYQQDDVRVLEHHQSKKIEEKLIHIMNEWNSSIEKALENESKQMDTIEYGVGEEKKEEMEKEVRTIREIDDDYTEILIGSPTQEEASRTSHSIQNDKYLFFPWLSCILSQLRKSFYLWRQEVPEISRLQKCGNLFDLFLTHIQHFEEEINMSDSSFQNGQLGVIDSISLDRLDELQRKLEWERKHESDLVQYTFADTQLCFNLLKNNKFDPSSIRSFVSLGYLLFSLSSLRRGLRLRNI